MVILLIVFALGEALVRIYLQFNTVYDIEMTRYALGIKEDSENPKISHVHIPGSEMKLMDVNVSINSDGLRDKEYSVEKTDAYRIIALGDSLTFGWGVEHDKTFQNILEEKVSQSRPVEVINFGTGNYNTEQEVNLFFEKGLKYNPDKVVLFYFINDAELTPEKSALWFLGYSHFISLYWSKINSLLNNVFASKSFKEFYSALYADDHQGWLNAKNALLDLKHYCDENSIELQVVVLPELHDTDNIIFNEINDKISGFLEQSEIDHLNLANLFQGHPNQFDLWVSYDDAHPNDVAHGRIAQSVVQFVSKQVTN